MSTTASTKTTTEAATVLIEGKAKIVRESDVSGQVVVCFKDAASAFNGQKCAEMPGKGELNASFSALLFDLLASQGLATCFVSKGSTVNELVYKSLTMIPIEVVVRNHAYGSIKKRFELEEGRAFKQPLVEFFLKDDATSDPQVDAAMMAELACLPEGVCLDELRRRALQANEVFVKYFAERGIRCADFKLEYGLDDRGVLTLGDELSPDNFRLRDIKTGDVLDKDVFRLDLADLVETYRALKTRLEAGPAFAFSDAKQTYSAVVSVKSRQSILSPESRAILNALHTQGFDGIDDVRAGKRFEVSLKAVSMLAAEVQVAKIATDILSNPVIEDVTYSIEH